MHFFVCRHGFGCALQNSDALFGFSVAMYFAFFAFTPPHALIVLDDKTILKVTDFYAFAHLF